MSWQKCNKCNGMFATQTNLKIHKSSCDGKKFIMNEEKKDKCVYKGTHSEETNGTCSHPPEEHHEGTCWHIVKPELKDQPTYDKYCSCAREPGLTKGWGALEKYEGKGWMEPERCKECHGEGEIILFRDPETNTVKKKQCTDCDGRGTSDLMITMECPKCKEVCLIRTDIKLCIRCEEQPLIRRNYFTKRVIN